MVTCAEGVEDVKALHLCIRSYSFLGKSSMFNTQKTHMADTLGSDRNQDTPEFALKPVAVNKGGEMQSMNKNKIDWKFYLIA